MNCLNVKELIFEHGQRYVTEVLADSLREEGFISNNDVHWYRLVNTQIVQSIFFQTPFTFFPILMDISCGCHPLYIVPEFPKGVYIYSTNYYTSSKREIFGRIGGTMSADPSKSNAIYSKDACVMCATDDCGKRETIGKILNKLESINTEDECYQMHKNFYLEAFSQYPDRDLSHTLTLDFMDEVVYFNDSEMYSVCEKRITNQLACIDKIKQDKGLPKSWEKEMNRYISLKEAIIDGERDKHLRYLDSQRQKTIKLLQKKVGIIIAP